MKKPQFINDRMTDSNFNQKYTKKCISIYINELIIKFSEQDDELRDITTQFARDAERRLIDTFEY